MISKENKLKMPKNHSPEEICERILHVIQSIFLNSLPEWIHKIHNLELKHLFSDFHANNAISLSGLSEDTNRTP